MARRFGNNRKFGVGEGFAETFAPAAHEAFITTLKDLLSQPERQQEMALRSQQMEAKNQEMAIAEEDRARKIAAEPSEQADLQAQTKKRVAEANLAQTKSDNWARFQKLKGANDPKLALAVQMAFKSPLAALQPMDEQANNVMQAYDMLSLLGTQKPAPATNSVDSKTSPARDAVAGKEGPDDLLQVMWNGKRLSVKRKNLSRAVKSGAKLVK